MNKLSSMLTFLVNKIGNTALGTTATTLTGAIAETFTKASKTETDLSQYMIRVAKNCGALSPVEGTGTIDAYIDITNDIPSGYVAFDVRCVLTQNYEFYCWKCDFNNEALTQVNLRLQKRSGVGGTIYPWIVIICVKDLS